MADAIPPKITVCLPFSRYRTCTQASVTDRSRPGGISDWLSRLFVRSEVLLDALVPSIGRPVCGDKQSGIALVPMIYWTGALLSSNIDVVPRTPPHRGANHRHRARPLAS
jgi:hypothetical protein